MNKILWVICLVVLSYSSSAQIGNCRSAFFDINSEEAAEQFEQLCSNMADPVLQGYEGWIRARMADYTFNPMNKWKLFSEGRDMLENAITLSPENTELKFIRLTIQLMAPRFLNYDSHIDSDLQSVLSALETEWMEEFPGFRKNIVSFLLEYGDLSENQNTTLRQLKS